MIVKFLFFLAGFFVGSLMASTKRRDEAANYYREKVKDD